MGALQKAQPHRDSLGIARLEKKSHRASRTHVADQQLLCRHSMQASRFLLDNNIRYVVWSVRESKDIEKWRSIMASIEADDRWIEFSDDPDSHVGLWIRR